MRFAAAISALSFAALAAAQNQTIQVGAEATTAGGIFQFMPPSINATEGSVITFVYSGTPGNHSITQSSFASPCDPLSGGFDSGFVFIPANLTSGFPSWNLTITNSSKPIWFYCGQLAPLPHCTAGMVGAINAAGTGNFTYDAFKASAISLAANGTIPGAPVPNLSGVGAAATTIPGPFSGSITGFALPTGTAPPASNGSSGASAPSGTSSGTSPSTTGNSAVGSAGVNGVVVFLAAMFGMTLL